MVKAVILCAGYGIRLAKDLTEDGKETYAHLLGIPKPLLPVGAQPLLNHWLNILSPSKAINDVIIVSNEIHKNKYHCVLEEYVQNNNKTINLSVISDGSTSNENRTGAVSCMQLGAGMFDEDILFIAGDTLLDRSFSLSAMIKDFNELKLTKGCHCLLISTSVTDDKVSKHGIIEVDKDGCVTSFLEKPDPSETKSRLQSPCIYLMSKECSQHLKHFLYDTRDQPLTSRDATGNFIKYLINQTSVYTYYVKKRFDIGNLHSYIECNNAFNKDEICF